jgi:hypothetical protein
VSEFVVFVFVFVVARFVVARFVVVIRFRFGFNKEAVRSGFELNGIPGFESDAFPCFFENGRKMGHGILRALRIEGRPPEHGFDIPMDTTKSGIRATLHAEFFGECLIPK